MVLGLTINFFNLRVECKMLDYNYDLHKDTIRDGRCVVPLRKELSLSLPTQMSSQYLPHRNMGWNIKFLKNKLIWKIGKMCLIMKDYIR